MSNIQETAYPELTKLIAETQTALTETSQYVIQNQLSEDEKVISKVFSLQNKETNLKIALKKLQAELEGHSRLIREFQQAYNQARVGAKNIKGLRELLKGMDKFYIDKYGYSALKTALVGELKNKEAALKSYDSFIKLHPNFKDVLEPIKES